MKLPDRDYAGTVARYRPFLKDRTAAIVHWDGDDKKPPYTSWVHDIDALIVVGRIA